MADEEKNGKNGSQVGLVEKVTTGIKEDLQSLKTDMPAKAKEQIEGLKDPTKTQVYTSIFRHKHDDTPRNRALGVLSNVFLHFIRRRSIAMPCGIAIRGGWAALLFICLSCSRSPACC